MLLLAGGKKIMGGWQEVVKLEEVHVFFKLFFSILTDYSLTGSFTPLSSGIMAQCCELEEDCSIIQLIISMSIFSQGSGDVGQSVLDPDWNTLASMDFHYAWFAEDESFFKYGDSWQKYLRLTRNKYHAAILTPLLLLRWHREHIKKNERFPNLYDLSCVLCMNLRTNAAYRHMQAGNGCFISLHRQ